MGDERLYYYNNNCLVPVQPAVTVCQMVGERQQQKSLDILVRVPRSKPAIEQVVDVYVKKVRITSVSVLCDKVIVRGRFEVKVLYVACRPGQPVHAVEVPNVRFTIAVDMRGAQSGMNAEARVGVEYVDYDCEPGCRADWHKQQAKWDNTGEWECGSEEEDCDDEDDGECADQPCPSHHHKKGQSGKQQKKCHPPCPMPDKCTRRCHVSVVLRASVQVFSTMKLITQHGILPAVPKG